VVDRQAPGLEASWAAAGMLTPASESSEAQPLIPFANASMALYPDFVARIEAESGLPAGYRRDGAVEVFFGEGAERRCAEWLAKLRAAGFQPQQTSVAELRRLEPSLAEDAAAGGFAADEGSVDNRLLTKAVATAAERAGVLFRADAEVTRVLVTGERATGVETRCERFSARHVLVAAGCYSGQIEGIEGYAPTVPARGQMAALRPAAMPVRHVVRGPSYLVPRNDGRLLVGATVEHAGFEKVTTAAGIGGLLSDAVRMVPSLAGAPVVETWCGLRPDTPDHLPILGPCDVEGLWFATGHYRNGILLTPATARAIGEWVCEGKTTQPVERFTPMRFAGTAPATARQAG